MNRRGAISIELAIVMPLLIIVIMVLVGMMKIYYVQDQIHSALVRSAHEMAVSQYAPSRFGVTDSLQEIYQQNRNIAEASTTNIGLIKEHIQALRVTQEQLLNYGSDLFFQENLDEEETTTSSSNHVSVLLAKMEKILREGPGQVGQMIEETSQMMNLSLSVLEDGRSTIAAIGLVEGLDYLDGIMANALTKTMVNHTLGDEVMKNLGIDWGQIDFSRSSMMLHEDTVTLVADYRVVMPLFGVYQASTIPLHQSVLARAYTGSYDASDSVSRYESSEKTKMYYIALTSTGNHSYHLLTCLRKTLFESNYHKEIEVAGRDICAYCASHYEVTDPFMKVYMTSSSSKIHLSDRCPRVYSQKIQEVTEAWALDHGYDPCNKKGCVVDEENQ